MKTIQIGTATLIHGDCEEFMKDMPDKCFDLACIDPPYGIGEDGTNRPSRGNTKTLDHKRKKWDKCPPSKQYFDQLIKASINRII